MVHSFTQKFDFETDNVEVFVEMIETICNILYQRCDASLMNPSLYLTDIPKISKENDFGHKIIVGKIHIYDNPKGKIAVYTGSDFKNISKLIKNQIKTFTDKDLENRIGSGYNYGFNRYDGTVKFGYKIKLINPWDVLEISIVHFYYGK